jgi:putative ABC transport system permease protein
MSDTRNWTVEVGRALGGELAGRTDLIEEIAQHVDARYRALLAQGRAEPEAYCDALEELSDPVRLAEEIRRINPSRLTEPSRLAPVGPRGGWLDALRYDVRDGARALRGSPGVTMLACLTLALGVGANTAIFTVVNAVLLRPLPFADPDRLVRIWESNPSGGWPEFAASHPNFLDWRAQNTSFELLAAMTSAGFTARNSEDAEIVRGWAVTAEFFPTLGIDPALGRMFRPDEDRPGGNTRLVVLTHPYWQRRFGGAAQTVGQSLVLNDNPYTIVGVLPESFTWGGPTLDLVVPLAPDPARSRGDHRLLVIGRLKAGVGLEKAHAELASIAARLERDFPDSNESWTVRLASFYDWLISADTRQSLLIMSGAVALVLLIACANVASLLLARGAARQRELAIRLALGADRTRIVRQLLVEAMLLALVGALSGLLIAYGAIELLTWSAPATLDRIEEVSIDWRVLAFALGAALATGVLFGLLPALQASRPRLNDTLKAGGAGSGTSVSRQRLRGALVVGEMALSVALLIAAGLLVRSLWHLQHTDPGFRQDHVMTARIQLASTRYEDGKAFWSFYERLLAPVRALPGVQAAAVASIVPMSGGNTSSEIELPGSPVRPGGTALGADWRLVSPDYFKTMGIPLRGRDFDERDAPGAQPVAVISEEAARRYFPNEDALGRTIIIRSFTNQPSTIIGIAGDVRGAGLDSDPAPMVYGSTKMYAGWNPMHLVLRGALAPETYVTSIRDAVRSIDSQVPVYDVRSAEELIAQSLGPRRFNMYLLTSFALVALLLSCIGLFGVMAYLVSQRTRDIGIRLALGAGRSDVMRLIVARGLMLAIAGAALGVAGGLAITDLMKGMLFSITPRDPATFIAVPLLLIAVAALACYLPARRATRVDPLVALRTD